MKGLKPPWIRKWACTPTESASGLWVSGMLSADLISLVDFREVLGRYQTHIEALSESKSKGQDAAADTLKELDVHRLSTIPGRLSTLRASSVEELALTKDEVEKLIKWKLKHGKFRPRLLDLVLSNASTQITSTTSRAFQLLSKPHPSPPSQPDIVAALTELVILKGIGPASASLLLSVYAPAEVPFFSDEAFRWVMFDAPSASKGVKGKAKGWDREIKYDKKEYKEYCERVCEVIERLGGDAEGKVGAREVEMVGWVLGRERAVLQGASRAEEAAEVKAEGQADASEDQEIVPTASKRKKRTAKEPEPSEGSTLRRSKRARS